MWWTVPCTRRKRSLCNELRMDIEDILKAKLTTITEEPEILEEMGNVLTNQRPHAKKRMKKIHPKFICWNMAFLDAWTFSSTWLNSGICYWIVFVNLCLYIAILLLVNKMLHCNCLWHFILSSRKWRVLFELSGINRLKIRRINRSKIQKMSKNSKYVKYKLLI